MPSKPQPDRFLNYQELADLIGLNIYTVKKGLCGTKDIPRVRLGGRVLFSFLAVQKWMAQKAREAEEAKQRGDNVIDLMSSKIERQRAVDKTLVSIINQKRGRYSR